MKKNMCFLVLFGIMMLAAGLLAGQVFAEQEYSYDVWFSLAFDPPGPPYSPVHECWTFIFDGSSWTLETSGPLGSGPAWVVPGNFSVFSANLSPGVLNQHVAGVFLNGTRLGYSGDVIGGVMLRGPKPGKLWGFEGVRNDGCEP